MRALTIPAYGETSPLTLTELPTPEPGPGEVRVRVEAAGVNPVDPFIRSGGFAAMSTQQLPQVVAGWELAGVVEALGAGVTGWPVGTAVVALIDWVGAPGGTHAEQVVLPADLLAARPDAVAPALAATVPLNALTAHQAVTELHQAAGATVLVTGAAGAVGAFAVQFAAGTGVRVVALAGPEDEQTVRRLGAEIFVARNDEPAAALRAALPDGVDGVVDAALLGESIIDLVRPGGTFVGLTPHSTPSPRPGVATHSLNVHGDGRTLATIMDAIARGELAVREVETYSAAEGASAYARLAKSGRRTGLSLVF
ncbi:NADP-dependent oxidoreductase [Frankia sp. QA3]|uniref:NADP-dependent oxidoreductase n=1 Tax=Frankia sp. QA3 TaxID=710111 RepID=UPI000269B72D|nr:NADP-dependent oxidoreductase [Frankia sp. QA3]EIV90674.1 Zn-dependent oxidoreductase, NADPH:quinone reductase [Frankia sp. QA3]